MQISNLSFSKNFISADVRFNSSDYSFPEKIYFKWDSSFLDDIQPTYDAFVVALIPVAQYLGEDIHVCGDIDIDLYENALEAISLFNSWYGDASKLINIFPQNFRPVDTNIKPIDVASFYSGGVDSLFSIAMKLDEKINEPVRYGIVVRGMDVSNDDDALWEKVKSGLITNSLHLKNFEPIFIETNARSFQSCGVNWTDNGFGPILGAISNLISFKCRKVLIGSYGLYKDLEPHASGPLIDRFWSSSKHSVIHYSPRFSRLEKMYAIKNIDPNLIKYLRVCWKNTDGEYNCGVCEKCLRTKMELRISGNSENTISFGHYNLLEDIKSLVGKIPVDSYSHLFWRNIRNKEQDPKIRYYIQLALAQNIYARIKLFTKKSIKTVLRFLKIRN